MKALPKNLLDRQETERLKTAEIVAKAISELESEGYRIKIQDLIKVTGLSRSVFSKPHVRQILVERGIVKPYYSPIPPDNNEIHREETLPKKKDKKKDEYIQRLLDENNQLRREVEILRGKIHILMHKVEMKRQNTP